MQIRYGLDERFVVRPLDGVTDDFLKRYLCAGYIDHDGYLLDRGVNFLLDFPNFNGDPKAWALSQLIALPVGQSLTRAITGLVVIWSAAGWTPRRCGSGAEHSAQPRGFGSTIRGVRRNPHR